jgi:RHS repeat-associated protein
VSKQVESSLFGEDNQFYFHPDHLGSTGYGTDEDGRLVDHQQYFPSGETWVDESRDEPTPFQFTGKELDPETGLYYYGARYYDPVTSVWQSADPIVEGYLDGDTNGGVYSPSNLAAYTYANNSPVVLNDPDGRSWSSFGEGLGNGAFWGAVGGVGITLGMAALAAVAAPVVVTAAGVGLAAAGVAGVAYQGYRYYNATGDDADRILGETIGGAAVGGVAAAGTKSGLRGAGRAAESVKSWWQGAPEAAAEPAAVEAAATAEAAAAAPQSSTAELMVKLMPDYGLPGTGTKTSGVLDIPGRPAEYLVSMYKGPAESMPKGTPGMNGRIKSHVEAHSAAIMRAEGAPAATLYINRVPCAGSTGCGTMLPRMLPENGQLQVKGPGGFSQSYKGEPD